MEHWPGRARGVDLQRLDFVRRVFDLEADSDALSFALACAYRCAQTEVVVRTKHLYGLDDYMAASMLLAEQKFREEHGVLSWLRTRPAVEGRGSIDEGEMKARLLQDLRVFRAPDVTTRTSTTLPAGDYELIAEKLDSGILWFKLEAGWIVADSGGVWAQKLGTPKDTEELAAGAGLSFTEDLDGDGQVTEAERWEAWRRRQHEPAEGDAAALAESIPASATVPARAAVVWMSRRLGVTEDLGKNRGRALDAIVLPYLRYQGITSLGSVPYCAAAASLSLFHALLGPLADPMDRSSWKRTPMGDFIGAAWWHEQRAIELGCWKLAEGLRPGQEVCGAVLCMERGASGSDRSTWTGSGKQYSGHSDLVVDWDGDELLCIGGNLSDTFRVLRRHPDDIRGLARYPLA